VSLSDEKSFSRQGNLLSSIMCSIVERDDPCACHCTNGDLLLTPGGFVAVRLALSTPSPTLLVPDASVTPDQSITSF